MSHNQSPQAWTTMKDPSKTSEKDVSISIPMPVSIHDKGRVEAWQDVEKKDEEKRKSHWNEFTQNTTLHGLKYIFDHDSPVSLRR